MVECYLYVYTAMLWIKKTRKSNYWVQRMYILTMISNQLIITWGQSIEPVTLSLERKEKHPIWSAAQYTYCIIFVKNAGRPMILAFSGSYAGCGRNFNRTMELINLFMLEVVYYEFCSSSANIRRDYAPQRNYVKNKISDHVIVHSIIE